MRGDKAKYDVTSISKLGLMEISRQRLKSTKAASAYVDCEICGGDGAVRAVESAALVALRKIHTVVAKGSLEAVQVVLPHDVAIHLLNTKREEIQQLEYRHKCHILVTVRDDLKRDGLEIVESKRGAPERPAEKEKAPRKAEAEDKRRGRKKKAVPKRATEAAVTDDDLLEEGALDEEEEAAPAKGKKRRRRKKPASRKTAAKAEEAPAEEEGAEEEAGTTKKRRRRRRGGRGRRPRTREGEAAVDENGAPADEGADKPAPEQVEVLVPTHSGEEPYLPPSIAAQASEAEHADDKQGSWWERFRRVLRSSGSGHAPEE
jgi:ribonuclease E